MSDVAIRAEDLGKRYRLGQREPYRTLREAIRRAATAPVRATRALLRRQREDAHAQRGEFIWALKDVSFELKAGEVLGVIGRNGAGKSTLLKLLTRITEPTTGHAEIHGRVGSLLEVGTGFHPELTGRENVYFNGAVLGMRKSEIERKFDQIIDFAEVEDFVDTPVKRYSSGMSVRLAFAVAAHLEPEILLVDEVLAVGDAAFQKKCLGKMGDVAREGRTVLFVSHNMGTIQSLCTKSLLLTHGRIERLGPTESVVQQYLDSVYEDISRAFEVPERPGLVAQVLKIAMLDVSGQSRSSFSLDEGVTLEIDYAVSRTTSGVSVVASLYKNGINVLDTWDTDLQPVLFEKRDPGRYRARVTFPPMFLGAGVYTVTVGTGRSMAEPIDVHRDAVSFEVEPRMASGDDLTHKSYSRGGMVIKAVPWSVEPIGAQDKVAQQVRPADRAGFEEGTA